MFIPVVTDTQITPMARAELEMGRAGDDGDHGVALDLAVLAQAQQQDGGDHHHGHGHGQGRHVQGRGDGQGAEAHMAQPVADHGIALEHQGHAQQRRAEADEAPHQQRPLHEVEGEHVEEFAHSRFPPKKRRARSLSRYCPEVPKKSCFCPRCRMWVA